MARRGPMLPLWLFSADFVRNTQVTWASCVCQWQYPFKHLKILHISNFSHDLGYDLQVFPGLKESEVYIAVLRLHSASLKAVCTVTYTRVSFALVWHSQMPSHCTFRTGNIYRVWVLNPLRIGAKLWMDPLAVPSEFLGPQGSPDPCAVTSAAPELGLRASNSVSV